MDLSIAQVVGIGIGVAGATTIAFLGAVFGFIAKHRKKTQAKKLAYKKQMEEKVDLLVEAVKGIANNNGLQNSTFIVTLDKFKFSDELLTQLKENALASENLTTEKHVKKIGKIKM